MGLGKLIKKTVVGTAKVAGSAVLGTIGVASSVVEYLGAGSNSEFLEDIGHGLKSASFNGVRNIWGAESIEYGHSAGEAGRRKADDIRKQRDKILSDREKEIERAERKLKEYEKNGQVTQEYILEQREKLNRERTRVRRTDEELSRDKTGTEKSAKSFQRDYNVPLSRAVDSAASEPGVYIIWLHGNVMKCGRASYSGGIHWRFTQYYNLKYDDRAREGDFWSISPENRDDVVVSWQCCPVSKCHELEYKLFKKYGKGEWALRAPASCSEDSWELLI